MSLKDHQILDAICKKQNLYLYAFTLACLFIFHYSALSSFLEDYVAHSIQLKVRESLSQDPKINPHLKVYAFDDYTVRKLHKSEFSLSDWSEVLGTFSESKPKGIIINEEFSIIPPGEDFSSFNDALAKAAPILIGSHTRAKTDIAYNNHLNLNRPEYQFKGALVNPSTSGAWLNILNHQTFGPSSLIEGSFYRIGHINYHYYGRIEPFRRVSKEHIIPHLTLLSAESFKISEKKVIVDHMPVHLDQNNLLPINFPSQDKLYQHTKSIYPIYKRAKLQRRITKVKEGDTIVIIPKFATGNSEMAHTPIGLIPRGFVVTSLVNSVLNKDWLTPINSHKTFIIFGSFIGALCGLLLSPVWFWLSLLGLCATSIGIFTALFSYANLVFPWMTLIISIVFSAMLFFNTKIVKLYSSLKS